MWSGNHYQYSEITSIDAVIIPDSRKEGKDG